MSDVMPPGITIGDLILAIGAIGTAAFAIVDLSKGFLVNIGDNLVGGGTSCFGFGFISDVVNKIFDKENLISTGDNDRIHNIEISKNIVLRTLKSNWINGTSREEQKIRAKALLRLYLLPETAKNFAIISGIPQDRLFNVAKELAYGAGSPEGPKLKPDEQAIFARLDTVLTVILDDAYESADQSYRNKSRFTAVFVAVTMTMFASRLYIGESITDRDWAVAFFIGLIAAPIAPIAKDLANGLTSATKVLAALKK